MEIELVHGKCLESAWPNSKHQRHSFIIFMVIFVIIISGSFFRLCLHHSPDHALLTVTGRFPAPRSGRLLLLLSPWPLGAAFDTQSPSPSHFTLPSWVSPTPPCSCPPALVAPKGHWSFASSFPPLYKLRFYSRIALWLFLAVPLYSLGNPIPFQSFIC